MYYTSFLESRLVNIVNGTTSVIKLCFHSQIKIIVAGGCSEWCVKNPPMASAELYDPVTNIWTQLPDLPFRLNSARMEMLGGLPTIFGGYNFDTKTQNDILLQYHSDVNKWIPHPTNKLKLKRSSHVAFQVPRNLFPAC